MNPSPVQPFLSVLLWEKTMHYIKVNIIFHPHPVEIAYFQFNPFILTLSTWCRKCFLTLWAGKFAKSVPMSTTHGQQQESQISLSPFICYNKMAKFDKNLQLNIWMKTLRKKSITFFSVLWRTCVSSCCRCSISLLAWCNWSWICCFCCLSVFRLALVWSRVSLMSLNMHSLACNWGLSRYRKKGTERKNKYSMSGLNLLQSLREGQSQAGRQLQRELSRRGAHREEMDEPWQQDTTRRRRR